MCVRLSTRWTALGVVHDALRYVGRGDDVTAVSLRAEEISTAHGNYNFKS